MYRGHQPIIHAPSYLTFANPSEIFWENYEILPDASSPVAYKDMLFVASSYGEFTCINTLDGSEIWFHEFDNGAYASAIIAEEKIFLLDRTGIMHICKADKEFQLISEPKLGEKSDCTPAFANGKIFIRGEKNLFCIGK